MLGVDVDEDVEEEETVSGVVCTPAEKLKEPLNVKGVADMTDRQKREREKERTRERKKERKSLNTKITKQRVERENKEKSQQTKQI